MDNVIRISDGLGNQLFQYACGYGIYRKTGRKFKLDILFLSRLRRYQLDYFRIDFSKRFVGRGLDYLIGFGPKHAKRPRRAYREYRIKKEGLKTITETAEMCFDERVWQQDQACYFTGFWQSYQYFDTYYEEIKRQFQLKGKLSEKAKTYSEAMQNTNSVSLHIRRTDYNRETNNVCVQEFYYKRALEQMKEKTGEIQLFVFTDDKEFVKQNFQLQEYTLVEGVGDLEEFALMQMCKHHIIANSTYSWWAAYLSENKGGVVFAPIAGIWKREFYLPDWNCIETEFIGEK